MRKIIVQELVTVDGCVADTSGGLDFFGSVSDYSEVDQANIAIMEKVDTILLGANTYRLFVDYWPTADDEVVARVVNTTPKIVFSSTIKQAPWGSWEPATVVAGDAAEHVSRLRQEAGGDIMVWGSIALAQSLMKAGLVAELQLRVIPMVLGAGRRLINDEVGQRPLELQQATPCRSGIVALHYALR